MSETHGSHRSENVDMVFWFVQHCVVLYVVNSFLEIVTPPSSGIWFRLGGYQCFVGILVPTYKTRYCHNLEDHHQHLVGRVILHKTTVTS